MASPGIVIAARRAAGDAAAARRGWSASPDEDDIMRDITRRNHPSGLLLGERFVVATALCDAMLLLPGGAHDAKQV